MSTFVTRLRGGASAAAALALVLLAAGPPSTAIAETPAVTMAAAQPHAELATTFGSGVRASMTVTNSSPEPYAPKPAIRGGAGQFVAESGSCRSMPVLAPNARCSVVVRYIPWLGRSHASASLRVGPTTIALTGRGRWASARSARPAVSAPGTSTPTVDAAGIAPIPCFGGSNSIVCIGVYWQIAVVAIVIWEVTCYAITGRYPCGS